MRLLPAGVWARVLKRRLPTSLWGRSLLIIVLPILVMQVAVTWAFFDMHWQTVTARLSEGLAGDIAWASESFADDPSARNLAVIADRAQRSMSLSVDLRDIVRRVGKSVLEIAGDRKRRRPHDVLGMPERLLARDAPHIGPAEREGEAGGCGGERHRPRRCHHPGRADIPGIGNDEAA